MEHYIQFFTFSFVENKHQMFNISPKVVEIKTKIKLCFLSKHYYAFWPFPVYMCFENHKKNKNRKYVPQTENLQEGKIFLLFQKFYKFKVCFRNLKKKKHHSTLSRNIFNFAAL